MKINSKFGFDGVQKSLFSYYKKMCMKTIFPLHLILGTQYT